MILALALLASWLSQSLVVAVSGEGLASMWRIELLHPMVAHFPIALMPLGTAFWILGGARRWWPRLDAFGLAGAITVLVAAMMAWAATQSGYWADEEVGRELYDPRPLKDHENLGVAFAWLATSCSLAALGTRFLCMPVVARRWAWWATAVALFVASGMIAYVAHLGASLVYQQGAGVIMPE